MSVSLVPSNKEKRDSNLNKEIIEHTSLNAECAQVVLSYLPFENVAARVLQDPTDLLTRQGRMRIPAYSALGECDCFAFDRNRHGEVGQLRGELERGVMGSLIGRPKDQILRVVDIGAGHLFSSLVYLVNLQRNFNKIELTVIDSDLSLDAVDALKECVATELSPLSPESTITIIALNSLDNYLKQIQQKDKELPHVILMIDLDNHEHEIRGQVLHEIGKVTTKRVQTQIIMGITKRGPRLEGGSIEVSPFSWAMNENRQDVQNYRDRVTALS